MLKQEISDKETDTSEWFRHEFLKNYQFSLKFQIVSVLIKF